MKLIDVGQEAIKAQGDVVQRVAARWGRRAAWFVLAAIFGVFALVSLHAVLWAGALVVLHFNPLTAAVTVLGIDVVIMFIFFLLGTRHVADPLEFEARLRRDRKFAELRQTLALSTFIGLLIGPVGRFSGRQAFKVARNIFFRR